MVQAILDAAALVIEREGLERLTTNGIARVAGVSVGSLYQYFPNKLAIVAELARRVEAEGLSILATESARLASAGAREAVLRLAHVSRAPSLGTGELRRALLREIPRGWILSETRHTDETIQRALIAFFGARASQLRPLALPGMTFVAFHALEGVSESVLLAWPEGLGSDAVQRELVRLAWAYVAPDGEDLGAPPIEQPDLPPLTRADAIAQRLIRPPRARSAPSARATRDAILAAAERVLTHGGFAKLSVRSIAREASVADGALYHYFANTQAVIEEVAARIEYRLSDALGEALRSVRTPHEAARALARAYTDEAVVPHALRRALLREAPRRWTEEAALDGAAVGHLARALVRLAVVGEPELRAFVVLHAVRAVTESHLLLEPADLSWPELHEELMELAARYIAG